MRGQGGGHGVGEASDSKLDSDRQSWGRKKR